jgi:hypothetical protein
LNDAFARIALETNRTINLLAALRPANTNMPVPAPPPSESKQTPSKANARWRT